ncbi:MAG: hypothetical protein ACR2GO_02630 [Candidatus Limnocylindria bacterium]
MIFAWGVQRPDLFGRVRALGDAIEQAGVHPEDWPYARDTATAATWSLAMQFLRVQYGAEYVVRMLKERWAADRRSRTSRRGGPAGQRAVTTTQICEARASLIAESEQATELRNVTKENVADRLKVSVDTIDRVCHDADYL